MNDPNEAHVDTREINISFTDITDFLAAAGVDGNCPACGSTRWSIVHNKQNKGIARYPAVPLASKERGVLEGLYMPVIFCVCKRCGYMRMHSLSFILDWIQGGRKAIEKDD